MKLRIKNVIIIDRRKQKLRKHRRGKPKAAIPHNRFWFFNDDQYSTYLDLKESGWRLYFIRRPRLRKHTIAMINNDGTSVGVLEESGELSTDPLPIKLRGLGEHLPPQQNVNVSHI
jgi:hypothetical protein